MTVQELIEQLEKEDPSLKIYVQNSPGNIDPLRKAVKDVIYEWKGSLADPSQYREAIILIH
jgi:hypothetical protein